MRYPLANYMATHTVNNKQHATTNGKAYKRLNKKLDRLLRKQSKHSSPLRHDDNHHFYPRVKNLTNIKFNFFFSVLCFPASYNDK